MHEITTAYSPEPNGATDRLDQTLPDMAWSMILGMKTQQKGLCIDAVFTVFFLSSRPLSKRSGESKTPYETIHSRRPILKHLRIYGSCAYAHTQKETCFKKSDSRALLEIFRVLPGKGLSSIVR